ncbi:rhodanese [Leptospira sp. 96542]|nr:rhodanese [Leptospira sp. 96542]
MKKSKLYTSVFVLLSLQLFCQGREEYQFFPPFAKVDLRPFLVVTNSVEALASESNDDYNLNTYGLVSPSTLARWTTDWSANKPQVIPGNLVVLQLQNGVASGEYIVSNGTNQFVYLVSNPDSIFSQKRNDNVLAIDGIVNSGKNFDTILSAFGIDPKTDFVLFAADTSTETNLASATKAYYNFRYWGFPKEKLGVLNGSVAYYGKTGQNTFFTVSSPSSTSSKRTDSVRSLFTDNTILQINLGDIVHLLRNGQSQVTDPSPLPTDGSFVLDSRPASAFNGTINSTPTSNHQLCTVKVSGSCVANHEGRIRGAKNIPVATLFDPTSLSFHSKATLTSLLNAQNYSQGNVVINYHRTGISGAIAQFVTQNIIGKPSRLYEAGWLQWGALGYRVPTTGTSPSALTQPASLWRTDLSILTDQITTNADDNVPNYSFTSTQQFTRSTNAIREEDKTYLRTSGASATPSGGSGGGAPTGGGGNACGG